MKLSMKSAVLDWRRLRVKTKRKSLDKNNNAAAASFPVSTTYFMDDDEFMSLPEFIHDEIPWRAGCRRKENYDYETLSLSHECRARCNWREKMHRSIRLWKKLGWKKQKSRDEEESISDQVRSILFGFDGDDNKTTLDFLLVPIHQKDVQDSVSIGSTVLDVSFNADYPQLVLQGSASDKDNKEASSSEKMVNENCDGTLGQGDSTPWNNLDTFTDAASDSFLSTVAQSPFIHNAAPTIIKRQRIDSSEENEHDDELSFSDSVCTGFDFPGSVVQYGS